MKVKVTGTILDYDGSPVQDRGADGKFIDLTWRMAFKFALNTPHVGLDGKVDELFTKEMQDKSYEVTAKLYSSSEPDFTPTQCAYIIERVKKMFENSPLIIGETRKLLGDIEKTTSDRKAR